MTERPVKIREMELSDMDGLMRMKNAEGWNQTEKDWELLIQYPESIRLVAVLGDRIIGTVTAINYAHMVAWIGMMLVDKNFRGRGLSKILLHETIRKLGKCASIKLDATPAGRPVYLKLGFKDEYKLYRMTHPSVSKISLIPGSVEAVRAAPGDLPDLAGFDQHVFGADRSLLIHLMVESYPELAWLIREDNKIVGFCLGRRGVNFTQIGPVYASADQVARSLIRSAVNSITGKAAVMDIPATQTTTIQWLEGCGFATQRPFDRMYLNTNPHPGITERQYLICGPELG
ncbi:MAG: GNAT family N-acetyltransferase [Bacteroidota bacterium]